MIRKNKFLTFCFALIPGVGQLYQGYMKRGVSLMILFWGLSAMSVALYMSYLSFLLPVIWAYSFFDVMNKWNWTIDQLALLEDKPIFNLDGGFRFSNKNRWAGGAVIAIGVIMLYNTFANLIADVLYRYFPVGSIRYLTGVLPTVVIAVAVILFGIKLLRGPKKSEREQQERWSESAAQWSAPEAHTEDGAPEQIESGEEEKK